VTIRPPVALAALLVGALAAAGCAGGGDDAAGARELPTVTQDQRVGAADVAAADALCRRYQDQRPAGVTQLRFRIEGRPSVVCVVQ